MPLLEVVIGTQQVLTEERYVWQSKNAVLDFVGTGGMGSGSGDKVFSAFVVSPLGGMDCVVR